MRIAKNTKKFILDSTENKPFIYVKQIDSENIEKTSNKFEILQKKTYLNEKIIALGGGGNILLMTTWSNCSIRMERKKKLRINQ